METDRAVSKQKLAQLCSDDSRLGQTDGQTVVPQKSKKGALQAESTRLNSERHSRSVYRV